MRLAAKLTGWKITVQEEGGKVFDGTEEATESAVPSEAPVSTPAEAVENVSAAEPEAESEPTLEEEILEQTPTIAEAAPSSDES